MIAGQLEIQMHADIIRLSKQLDDAENHIRSWAGRVEGYASSVGLALGGIAAGLSVGGLLDFMKRTIDSAAGLHDLSMSTGMTVDRLSELVEVGRTTETTVDDIGAAMAKLQKNVAGASDATAGAGGALAQLGIDYRTFRDLHPDEQMLELAKATAQFENGGGKAAVVMQLLGKEGAKLIPFLTDLAEAEERTGRVTAEQAALADELGDGLAQLQGEVEGLSMQVGLALLPVLQKLPSLLEPALKLTVAYFALFHGLPALGAAAYAAFNAMALGVYSGTTALGVFNASLASTVALTQAAIVQAGRLKTAAAVLFAAFAGWEIGTWLRENFLEARLAGIALVEGLLVGWENVKAGAEMMWAGVKAAGKTVLEWVGQAWAAPLDAIGQAMQAIGMQESGAAVRGWADQVRQATKSSTTFAGEIERIARETEAAKKQIRDITGEMADEAVAAFAVAKAVGEKKKRLKEEGGEAVAAAKAYEALRKQYAALVSASQANVRAMEASAEGAEDLAQGEKRLLEMQSKIEAGTLEYNAALYAQAAAQFQAEAASERSARAMKLAAAEAEALAEVRQRESDAVDAHIASEEARALQTARAAEEAVRAARLEYEAHGLLRSQIAQVTLQRLLDEQAGLRAGTALYEAKQREIEAQRELIGLMQRQEARDANEAAAKASADAWTSAFADISQALTSALMEGGRDGSDYVEGYLRAAVGRALQAQIASGLAGLFGGGGAQAAGGTNWLGLLSNMSGSGAGGNLAGSLFSQSNISAMAGTYLSAMYGNGASAYAAAIGATEIGAGSQAAMLAAQTGEFGAAGLSATSGAAAGAGAGTASTMATAIPIIGWIIAGIMASLEAYKGGANVDLLPDSMLVGDHERRKFDHLSKLGFSDKWANVLSGASLVARTFGHKASVSGYGIGTVQGGDFVQGASAPFQFGKNTMGGGADPWLQDLASDITASVGLSAGLFGGGLTEGMRFGALTDRDRENEVAALLGFFGADNKLLAGTQTGSGAFAAGGPGKGAAKIKSEDFEQWIADNMPVLIIQGLQQSDLDARFETYFDSVGAAKLTPELASQMLTTATAVQRLTDTFSPLGGAFDQFEVLTVAAFEKLAAAGGGFETLGQNIGTYYQAFYSESERTEDAWASITKTLNEVGVTTIPTTREGFRALVDSLDDLSTEADQKAFGAIMRVSGAFSALVEAERERVAAVDDQQLQLQIALLEAQGRSTDALTLARQAEIAQLAELEQSLGVTAGTFTALQQSIYAANTASAVEDTRLGLQIELLRALGREQEALVLERGIELDQLAELEQSLGVAAGTFTTLKQSVYAAADAAAAANSKFQGMRITSMGQASAADQAYREWLGMESKIAGFESDWAAGTLPTNLQDYVDNWWGGKEHVPNPTKDGLFNLYLMQGDVFANARVQNDAAAREATRSGGGGGGEPHGPDPDLAAAEQLRAEQDQLKQMMDMVELLDRIEQSMTDWANNWQLGELSNLDPTQQYELASDNLSAIYADAMAGNWEAFDQWQAAADSFLRESNSYFGGGTSAAADKDAVYGMWEELMALRESMEGLMQRNIDAVHRSAEQTTAAVHAGTALQREAATQTKLQASSRIGLRT